MKKTTTIAGLFILLIYAIASATDDKVSIHSQHSNDALFIDGENMFAILKTTNGCGIGNFLIVAAGDTALGIRPTLGALLELPPGAIEVLHEIPGTEVKGVAFKRISWSGQNTSIITTEGNQYPYVVVTDSGLFSYTLPYDFNPGLPEVSNIDSIILPGTVKMAGQTTTDISGPIVLYKSDSVGGHNIHVFSYPDLLEQFAFPFHFEPEIFEIAESEFFIAGHDTSGDYSLYHFSALQDTLLAVYHLNDSASNAQEFLKIGDSLFFLSSPGDSMVVLTALNTAGGQLYQTVVYSQSGARATNNEYKGQQQFTFQPVSDTSGASLDKQILTLNPIDGQSDTLPLNRQLDYFKQPSWANPGFGFFELNWVAAKWDTTASDSIFIASQWGELVKSEVEAFPRFINATYGCWVGLPEEELEKIKFTISPNPASSQIIIHLSGLEKGRQYQLDISDISGKIHFTTHLEAYQEILLPLHTLSKGMYVLNLNTGRNLISQKLVVQ